MAIFHLSVKIVSRSAGRSATAAAAYRAGWMITDERSSEVHDYTRKAGVASLDLILPADAPAWASDRAVLWNAVEQRETRKNSTVAREFVIALPAELDAAGRRKLALDFAREIVDRHGCVADVAIHAPGREGDDRNHHAHILISTRRLTPEGFTDKTRELDDLSTGEVTRWRERYAQLQNERLTAHGHTVQVDHRSLREQGVDRVPTSHLGPAVSQMKRERRASNVLERIQREHRLAANDRYRLQLVSSNLKAIDAEIADMNVAIHKLMVVESQERDVAFKAEQDRLQRLAAARPIVVEQEMPTELAPVMPVASVAAVKLVEPARPIAAPPMPGTPVKPPSPTVAVPGRPTVAGARPITSGIPDFPINGVPRKPDLPVPTVTPLSRPGMSAKTITSAILEWPAQAASQPSGVPVPAASPRVPVQVPPAAMAAPNQPGIGTKPTIFKTPEFAVQPAPQKPGVPAPAAAVPRVPGQTPPTVMAAPRQPLIGAKPITSAIPDWPVQTPSQKPGTPVSARPRTPVQVPAAAVAAPTRPSTGAKPTIFSAPAFATQPAAQKPKLPAPDMPVPPAPILAAVSVLQGVRVVILNVPFMEKDDAKAAGARWSKEEKYWYVRASADLTRLTRWIPPAPGAVLPDPVPAAKTTEDYRAELVAEVKKLTKTEVEIVDRELTQSTGIVFAMNDRFAAMHIGRSSILIVDRETTPIELGRWQIRNRKVEQSDLTPSDLSFLRRVFCEGVTEQLDRSVSHGLLKTPERSRSPGMER